MKRKLHDHENRSRNLHDGLPAWSRRSFLSTVGWGLAGLALPVTGWAASAGALLDRRSRSGKVLVLGAGLAGLAAAWELKEAGHEVTILEARNRPGGRVLSLRESFADGLFAEAGGMVFNDRYRHFQRYRRIFGLNSLNLPNPAGLGTVYHLHGQRLVMGGDEPVSWPYTLRDDEREAGPWGLFGRYAMDVVETFGDPGAPDWSIEPLLGYDEMSFADYLRSRGASEGALELLSNSLWFGAGIETVSALSLYTGQIALFHKAGAFQVLEGGNDSLPRAMASRLHRDIRYGVEARSIRETDDGIKVVCHPAGEGEPVEFVADRVICALPLPVLGNIEVDPVLPAALREACSGLPYLPLLRMFAQMRKQYWLEQKVRGSANTDLPIGQVQQHPLNEPGGIEDRAILEGHLRGALVAPVVPLSEGGRMELLVEGLEKVHPGTREHFEGGVTKSWVEDRLSGGGFSWYGPGQVTRWLPVVSRPHGRLHFAGEHTSAINATMEGALASGVRAARAVHEEVTRS